MAPGIMLVLFFEPGLLGLKFVAGVVLGVLAACLTSSSSYVLNEILDAPRDAHHPTKCLRPIPSGEVNLQWAYAEWLLLAVAGVGLGFAINAPCGFCALGLWVAGLLYNVPPVRLKDRAYIDVLSESVNNPLRLGLGWYCTGCLLLPPVSAALAYWAFGGVLMAMKRYAEYRHIGDPARAARYRESFSHYTDERLIESVFFYGACFGLLSGVFIARYHVELVLATPLVALALAYYMHLGFKPDSPVQFPERLIHQRKLMLIALAAFVACGALLLVTIPAFRQAVHPTAVLREGPAF